MIVAQWSPISLCYPDLSSVKGVDQTFQDTEAKKLPAFCGPDLKYSCRICSGTSLVQSTREYEKQVLHELKAASIDRKQVKLVATKTDPYFSANPRKTQCGSRDFQGEYRALGKPTAPTGSWPKTIFAKILKFISGTRTPNLHSWEYSLISNPFAEKA